eukprot:scaffold104659_cov69-Phaeocystis_antarctica.AAC.7
MIDTRTIVLACVGAATADSSLNTCGRLGDESSQGHRHPNNRSAAGECKRGELCTGALDLLWFCALDGRVALLIETSLHQRAQRLPVLRKRTGGERAVRQRGRGRVA